MAREPSQPDAVQLLDGGGEAFPPMLAAIASARSRIHLEFYAFSNDATGRRFLEALRAASQRGVAVYVSVDGWGSAMNGRHLRAVLQAAGASVRIYNPLSSALLGRIRRNHRKLLVVDDEVAYLGGLNLDDHYGPGALGAGWADLVVELRGPSAAWLGRALRGQRAERPQNGTRITLSGVGGGRQLHNRYLHALRRAKSRVLLAHAYFLPSRRVEAALRALGREGTEVVLLLAGRSDVLFARTLIRRSYGRLLHAGVKLWELTSTTLHAKVAVVDGTRVLLGSFNLDPLSLVNLEILVEIENPALAAEVESWIRTKLSSARAVEQERAPERFIDLTFGRLGSWLLRRFVKLLNHG